MPNRQDYKIKTPYGEIVHTIPGKNGPLDMKIFTTFPKMPWPHSLYYIAVCLRLKAMVEDRNYPPPAAGRGKLMEFCHDCIFSKMTIREICRKHQIELPDGG
jgi:hypothetical protein